MAKYSEYVTAKLQQKSKPIKLAMVEACSWWAFYTIRIWEEKLLKFKIGKSGHLENSFSQVVKGSAQGENITIIFKFLYYGRFVDMGVGKGTTIADVGQNKTSRYLNGKMVGNRRIPKKWYSRTLMAESTTLKEILARDYAHKGVVRVLEELTNFTEY